MAKLVILKFNGNFESGFKVSLEIGQEGKSAERGCSGSLPPTIELSQSLFKWQWQYKRLGSNQRIKPQQIIYDGSLPPQKQLLTSASNLRQALQCWLDSPGFSDLDKHLREELNRREAIRMLICSDRSEIYQLPWCSWDLVENYPNLEIAVSNFNFERVPIARQVSHHNKVRILAILGDGQGINLEADRNFLNSLSDGEVFFLVEPTPQELHAQLWQETWDIVFFAGHSKTINRQGIIYLNGEDQLTIEQLRNAFKRAIASGLQLAIFNSCDGLGLAEELGKLSLPQSIVMRMPIPDLMAQYFVKYFLEAYSQGESLYIATRRARERLQGWEKHYPCASWLPTIYQNPAVIPPNWNNLQSNNLQGDNSQLQLSNKLHSQELPFTSILLISAIVTVLVCLIQSWGWLQTSELKAYDRLMAWGATPSPDQRVLVVTIQDDDIKYQREQGMVMNNGASLADAALDQLLNKLKSGQPKAIASDVIHDFPFDSKLANTVAKTDNFFGICRVKIDQPKLISISPPSPLPPNQVGFSNLAIDNDGAIRRQILGMSPDNTCQSSLSLSLRLALQYLDNVPAKYDQQSVLEIGEVKFPKLDATSGGYHLPEAQGFQILLNYDPALPQTISLREILTMPEPFIKELVDNKIVLIGVVGYNQDLHHTPYSRGQQAKRLPGVVIHAQMTNHIISAVLREKKLIWWLPDKVELLWIGFWSMVGSGLIILGQRSFTKIAIGIFLSFTLIFGCSWLLFINDGWLVAIAPAVGLLISAGIASVYSRIGEKLRAFFVY